jgi:methylenetetrahydrofolate reductase (NADPH)
VGIRNILALQGDAPKGKLDWVATPGGCPHAVDLVRLIRKHFGSHFCIAVGGFPEGHPRSGGNLAQDVSFLKEKVPSTTTYCARPSLYEHLGLPIWDPELHIKITFPFLLTLPVSQSLSP